MTVAIENVVVHFESFCFECPFWIIFSPGLGLCAVAQPLVASGSTGEHSFTVESVRTMRGGTYPFASLPVGLFHPGFRLTPGRGRLCSDCLVRRVAVSFLVLSMGARKTLSSFIFNHGGYVPFCPRTNPDTNDINSCPENLTM